MYKSQIGYNAHLRNTAISVHGHVQNANPYTTPVLWVINLTYLFKLNLTG